MEKTISPAGVVDFFEGGAAARRVIDGFLEYGFFPLAEGKEYIYVGTDTSNLIHAKVQFMDVHYEKITNSIKTVEEKHIEISKVTGVRPQNDLNKFVHVLSQFA